VSTTAHRSTWADDDVIALKEMATKFFETEALPHRERWAAQKCVDRDFWYKAGELGLLCTSVPEEYGGGGGTLAHDFAVMEAQAACGESGFGNQVHSGLVAHYILAYGTDEQKRRWLPGMASGALVSAIAMTEPGGGSDLKALRTTAIRNGDHYRLNGAKTFTSNGSSADLIVLVVKTDPAAGTKGVSLLVLETADAPGFRVGRVLEKVGMKAQDTAELFFDDVLVPAENLLGEEGAGYGDDCIERHLRGELDATTASMAKAWVTDMQVAVIDRCVQLFGGYGYMLEYPIARMFVDSRAQKIYAGANEVMKELIARSL
jgi:acyl-CoA dehydrogenase